MTANIVLSYVFNIVSLWLYPSMVLQYILNFCTLFNNSSTLPKNKIDLYMPVTHIYVKWINCIAIEKQQHNIHSLIPKIK